MKLGTIIKLGLIGGGIYYVKKNGGLKATWDKLSSKLESVMGELKADVKSKKSPMRSTYESDTDFASSSSYGDEARGSIGNDKTGYNRG